MARISRTPSILAMAAALSMAGTPAFAAEFSAPSAGIPSAAGVTAGAGWDSDSENAERRRHRRYRRNRGIDAGDVIAGVLVLGTIAAVASAASRDDDRRDTRYRDRDYRYRDSRDRRSSDTGGLNRAVDICVQNIERNVRVDSVDNVDRNGQGWRVSGSLYNGEGFICRIGSDGRIEGVDYGANYQGARYQAGAAPVTDRQYSDERYQQAWRDTDTGGADYYRPANSQPNSQANTQANSQSRTPASGQPAYPGGPINGEAAQVDLPQDGDFGG